MLKSPSINIFHPLLILTFVSSLPDPCLCHYCLFLKSHSFSNPLRYGSASTVFLKLLLSQLLTFLFLVLVELSVLLLFQSPGTIGLILTLGFGDANSPGLLPTSSSLLLRPPCQFPFFCLFLKVIFLSVWFGTFSSHSAERQWHPTQALLPGNPMHGGAW